jgi:hypothetical protein
VCDRVECDDPIAPDARSRSNQTLVSPIPRYQKKEGGSIVNAKLNDRESVETIDALAALAAIWKSPAR